MELCKVEQGRFGIKIGQGSVGLFIKQTHNAICPITDGTQIQLGYSTFLQRINFPVTFGPRDHLVINDIRLPSFLRAINLVNSHYGSFSISSEPQNRRFDGLHRLD